MSGGVNSDSSIVSRDESSFSVSVDVVPVDGIEATSLASCAPLFFCSSLEAGERSVGFV